jgi:hypothetical protein
MPVGINKRNAAFLTVLASSAILFGPSLVKLVQVSMREEHFSHIPRIPVVSAILIWLERKKIFSTVEWNPRRAAALVLSGAALAALPRIFAVSWSETDILWKKGPAGKTAAERIGGATDVEGAR